MKTGLVFLFASLLLFLIPYTYLERIERRKFAVIKRGGNLSKSYHVFDGIFLLGLFGLLIYLTRYYVTAISPVIAVIGFICIDMIKTGIFAAITGKFPYRTRSGIEFFYTDYSNVFSKQKITVKSLGWLSALSSFIFMIVAGLVL